VFCGLFTVVDQRVTTKFKDIVEKQLGLKPGEQVLIAADSTTEPEKIAGLFRAVSAAGGICTVAIQPDTGWDAKDLYAITEPAQEAYCGADVVIAAGMSSSATLYGRPQKFRDLVRKTKKARLFSMVERPLEIVLADRVDYYKLYEINKRIEQIFRNGEVIRITTNLGTDFRGNLQFDKTGWAGHYSEHGLCLNPGDFGACPDGEVHVPPPPESMEGVLVIDGPVANICKVRPDEPIRVEVRKGRIVDVKGGRDALRLKELIDELGQDYVSEIGMGTNPDWIVSPSLHGVKKGLGNVHSAYGGWLGYQPTIPYKLHGDMVCYNGTVEVDGKVIMSEGKLYLD